MFERLEWGSTLGLAGERVPLCESWKTGGSVSQDAVPGREPQVKGTACTKALRQEEVSMLEAQKVS